MAMKKKFLGLALATMVALPATSVYAAGENNIINGMTIIPSGIKGNAQENWKKQQIFLVDFDNTYKGEKLYKDNPKHISIEKILNYCKSINFEPTFIIYNI